MYPLGIIVLMIQLILMYVFGCGMVIKMRQPYLRRGYALPRAGTLPIPIEIEDPIVDFYIDMYATNNAHYNCRSPIKYVLNSVQIVDGSDVLFALDAEEILALDFYHYKESLHMGIDERADQVQHCDFDIPLGLGRVDPVVAFDPTRFSNPMLILDWDLDNVTPFSFGGWADPQDLAVTIMADVIDEAPARPEGYLMTKQVVEYSTGVAGGNEYISLPTDYPYRTMFLRANAHCSLPEAIITKARHDCDEQKYQPFEIYTDDWAKWDKKWYGFWHQGYWFTLSGGSTTTRDLNLRGNLAVAGGADASHTDTSVYKPSTCMELDIISPAGAEANHHVKADGTLPMGTFAWPYGDPDQPEEWLDITTHRKSRLTLESGVADTLVQVFLTQYRKY